jgi:hypothetical protein
MTVVRSRVPMASRAVWAMVSPMRAAMDAFRRSPRACRFGVKLAQPCHQRARRIGRTVIGFMGNSELVGRKAEREAVPGSLASIGSNSSLSLASSP